MQVQHSFSEKVKGCHIKKSDKGSLQRFFCRYSPNNPVKNIQFCQIININFLTQPLQNYDCENKKHIDFL